MRNLIKDTNGKDSSVRTIGFLSFAVLALAAFTDMVLAVGFATDRNIPDIIYYTFSSIVGAAFFAASWQHVRNGSTNTEEN